MALPLPADCCPAAVGWQLWVGAAVGAFPWFLGAYEFGKRIVIQRQCERCAGTGLVGGEAPRKCPECGGFFPWESWQQFLTSDPGNGGPLRAPKGQTSVFYSTEVNRPKGGAAAGGGRQRGRGRRRCERRSSRRTDRPRRRVRRPSGNALCV